MPPISGPPLTSGGPDFSWLDPRVVARATLLVEKGLYPDVAACLNHALRSYFKITA